MNRKIKPPNLFSQRGRPSMHIHPTNVIIAGGQSHTITCSVSSISDITDITWIKTTAVGYEIVNKVDVDGKLCGGTLSDPSLTINNIVNSDEGTYVCKATNCFGSTSSEYSVLTFKDEADSLSKQENNCLRLLLCQKIATQAVRLFFDREVPRLGAFLLQHKSNLTSKSSVYRCTREQTTILFPGGQVAVNSADFDFTLLYKLIRNLLTTIPAPTCGWGNQPLFGHLNETDDIERIRHLRNNFAHNSKFEIDDTDFSTHWTDLSKVIDRLSNGSLSTDVESMRTKSFDKCIKNEMENNKRKELKEMREELTELQLNFDTRHIPLNIQKGHNEQINTWRIEDEPFYKETRGFTAVLDMVMSKNYMTIIGGPGSGKTATARHIALQLGKQGLEVVPVCRLDEILLYGDRDYKQVFVLDDVLGIFAVDMNIYNQIISHKEKMFKTIGGTSKLLFTCRKSVYKEALKFKLFVTENIVDLQSKENQLNGTEKVEICKYHCENKDVSPYLYASLSFTKANHMFPLLCKVFSREEKHQQLGESFFNKPFECFISELDKLQYTNRIQYAVLVLCLVTGKLSVELLPQKPIKEEVFNNCGLNLGTPDKQIKDAIYEMSETYFTKLDTEYTFMHEFIFEAIAYHYGRHNQHHIIKHLSSSYIANKVIVCEEASNDDHCIHISKDMYLPLAERLYTDICSINLFDVFMNKSLLHSPFCDVFEKMLKTKPLDKFESLILRSFQDSHHFVKTTFSAKKPIQQMIDIIEFDRLHVLFGTIHRTVSDSKHTCNVRVISWIINYGHTHLLQEIVNHVKCNNHSISLIFGSDVMENTRLLLLGCYSNTLGIVELILKYVDPKCINTDFTFVSLFDRNVTPLIAGCMIGNLDIVKVLLRNNADINKCNKRKTSPLITASSHGHIYVVKYLIRSGSYINFSDILGHSPLFAASLSGHYDVVKYLHNSGADINLRDKYRQSPLFLASMTGHCDVVKYLLSSGADINLIEECGQSPLFLASMSGYCEVVKCLLSFGADINLSDRNGKSPLFVSSDNGLCDVVKCLSSSGADVNLCDGNGQSPLFVASQKGKCDVVKCLLISGAEINLCDDDGESPLFIASQKGECDVVKSLLSSGAEINLRNKRGQSPLFVASKYGHSYVVKRLFSSGADINLRDDDGESPLFVASQKRECDVVKCLLNSGAEINVCNKREQSPLLVASMSGHCDVVKCLLSSGAEINLCDDDGQSPLYLASMCGYCDVVKCLLSPDPDINLCDKQGQSPLFVASMFGYCDVVKCLLSAGADIYLYDKQEQSPLFVASHHGRCDVVKCLLSYCEDINSCNDDKESPLFVASQKGEYDVVKCLLNYGADVNLCNDDEESPLFAASQKGKCDVMKRLLSFGAEINLYSKRGQSPLFVASKSGQCDVVKCLLSSGADINLCDDDGESPLFIASWNGHCDVVKCLLRSGAEINLHNKRGQSLLFGASMSGHCDVVKCLLSSGAEINLGNKGGETPLFAASMYRHCDVVKCLLSSGAEINLCDDDGESPLFLASTYGHCDVVKCLLSFGAETNLRNERGQSVLFGASMSGHCDVVECLLISGADINVCDDDGKSPLFVASSSGYNDIVILLKEHGALHEENVKAQY